MTYYLSLDGARGNLSMGGFQIKSLADPTVDSDAATQGYVKTQAKSYVAGNGLSLSGSTFSVNFSGNGSGSNAAYGNHSHSYGDGTLGGFASAATKDADWPNVAWFLVQRNGIGDIYVTNVHTSSDARLKENITNLELGTREVKLLRPVSFLFKNSPDTPQMGLVAQEVEEVFPALVKDDGTGFKSVNYMSLIAVLLKCVQELDARITALEGK